MIKGRARPDQRSQAAINDLERVITNRYPSASFDVTKGDDPEGFYLKATVNIDDVEEVVDHELLDRLYDIQVEQGLAVYVIPLRPADTP